MNKELKIHRIIQEAGKKTRKKGSIFLQFSDREVDPDMYDMIDQGEINPFANLINSKEENQRIQRLFTK